MAQALMFLSGKRTPFGANGGALKDINPTDLCVSAGVAALKQSGLKNEDIDHLILGNVLHSAPDSIYTPRHVGLKLGVPIDRPALGINRLCGSGFQVIVEAFQQFQCGDSSAALIGGVENMSLAPYVMRGARWGLRMGNATASDTLMEALTDSYAQAPMAITAENLAVKYGLSREEVDTFAVASQTKTENAMKNGHFNHEVEPFEVKDKKGNPVQIHTDEHPRAGTTLEKLLSLKPVFKKDGVVTAGNASGIVDGAAMMVVATEKMTKDRGCKPLGRLVSYGVVGCDPKIMGIGPVPAAKIALKRAGKSIGDMDLVEVNEAFAAQTLSVQRELEIDSSRLNVNGGAIAIGHPLAASGTRITMQLLYELRRRKKTWGLASACIGGGQGIAIIVEAFN